MNSKIKNLKIEKVLFIDVETVYKSENLEVGSPEFNAFQWKMRDRVTDELHEAQDVLSLYKRKAPLYLTYNKIVCISVGYVTKGVVRIKAITGEESDIIKEFCDIANQFEYVAGVNVLGFDFPVISSNGAKYFDMLYTLKDQFSVSAKKSWNINNIIDLLDHFKGTGFINPSLEEMCLHFGINTPKDDISGADVSRVYYEEDKGIDRIAKYCNKDVFSTINLFQAMRFEERFEDFTEVSVTTSNPKQHETLLSELYTTKMFNETFKERLTEVLLKMELTEEDVDNMSSLILANYLNKSDLKAVKLQKEEEVVNYLKKLEVGSKK